MPSSIALSASTRLEFFQNWSCMILSVSDGRWGGGGSERRSCASKCGMAAVEGRDGRLTRPEHLFTSTTLQRREARRRPFWRPSSTPRHPTMVFTDHTTTANGKPTTSGHFCAWGWKAAGAQTAQNTRVTRVYCVQCCCCCCCR